MELVTNINYPTIGDLVGKYSNLSLEELACDRTYNFIMNSKNQKLIEATENCEINFQNCDGKIKIIY